MTDVLKGKRFLVIEDEYLIAADLRRVLTAKGATIVGPTGNFARAMAMANEEAIDAALVDINLGDVLSYPIVDRLIERDIPYLFLTGYDRRALPPVYRNAPRLEKPVSADMVVSSLAHLLTTNAAG